MSRNRAPSLSSRSSLSALGLVLGAASLLACAAGGSVEGGSFTKELALSPQVAAPKEGEQTEVRLAASRTQHLAVWIDRQAIVAARVRDGALLDARPMLIHRGSGATVPDGAAGIAVASSGEDFLVLWTERHLGSGDLDVRFARVTGQGVVLDPGGRALAETEAREHGPTVQWTEYGWITAYRSRGDVRMVRLDANGRNLDSRTHTVSSLATGDAAPALVPADHGALIAFGEANKMMLARTDLAGGVERIGAVAELLPESRLTGVEIAKLGDGYVVGFAERVGPFGMTRVVRLSSDGLPRDAQPMVVADRGDRAPSIVWNGQLGLIAAEGATGIEITAMTGWDLAFGGRHTVQGVAPYLANLGSESLLGFVRHDGGVLGANTYFLRIAPDGSPIDTTHELLSRGWDVQLKPSMAMGNYGSLIAWTDSLNAEHTGMDVRYAQLSLDGRVQKTATLGTALDDFAPTVATDGTKYLVAWGDADGAARVALIDEIGNLLRTSRLPFGDSKLAAAWNGRVYLIATPSLGVARIDRVGVPLDAQLQPLFPGLDSSRLADDIALAPSGDGFLAAYHWNNGYDLISTVPIGPNATVTRQPLAVGFGRSPALAWDGERHTLAYWNDDGKLTTARLLANGLWTEAPARTDTIGTGLALASASGGGVLLSYTDSLGILQAGTLRDGRFSLIREFATKGTASTLATFGSRFGIAYEAPGLDATAAVRAKLFTP